MAVEIRDLPQSITHKPEQTIGSLAERVAELNQENLFHRFFRISRGNAVINVDHMPKVAGLSTQDIVKVYDCFTHKMAVYNRERMNRPMKRGDTTDYLREINEAEGHDPFCDPEKYTPTSVADQIIGASCRTRANLYPFGVNHEVIIFNKHHPLVVPTLDQHLDRLEVADRWFDRMSEYDSQAIYPSMVKNTSRKDGASIPHGHAQIKLERDMHEAKMMQLMSVINFYHHIFGTNYLEDLFAAYRSVDLGLECHGVKIIPTLTPAKEDEVIMYVNDFNQDAREVVDRVVRAMILKRGNVTYNMGVCYPPRGYNNPELPIPHVVNFVGRGDLAGPVADYGGSEICMGTIIVSSDPNSIQRDLETALAA